MRTLGVCLVLLGLSGCGGDAPAGSPAPSATAPVDRGSGSVRTTAAPTAAPSTPADASPPVDLLHAVDASLAASSVYRDRADYVDKMVDGDLATAWNGATGELEGAHLDVRLPTDVTVTGVAMTVGFTKQTEAADLFTGNLRIAEVRVSHDGTLLGTFPLDPESRELQTIPITGGGGTYRIEITRTVPGTHENWRELCISELRVMGRSPLAHPGERSPRTGVGELPAPPPPPDLAALATHFERDVAAFERGFIGYEWTVARIRTNTDTELAVQDREAADAQYAGLARRAAATVEGIDGLAADRIRRSTIPPTTAQADRPGEQLATLIAGYTTVAERLDTDAARCAVARSHVRIRFERITAARQVEREMAEIDESFGSPHARPGNPTAPTAAGVAEPLRESTRLVDAAKRLFARSPREALASLEGHPVERVSPDVAPMLAAMRIAAERCPAE